MANTAGTYPELIEMTSYHARAGAPCVADFLPNTGGAVTACRLTTEEQRRKRAMYDCFTSQADVIASFRTNLIVERYRTAPSYVFRDRPHLGDLYYEILGLGTWESFRESVMRAEEALALT